MPALTNVQELTDLDYLVVGGGTAGLVVASRLSEDLSCTVGLLEAGLYHENDPTVDIPGMSAMALFNPKYDWSFFTVPQKYANNKQVPHPRGKGIGGSSAINFLASVRPGRGELDGWEELGNPGWNWDTMLTYLKKSEHLESVNLSKEEAERLAAVPEAINHGTDGPIAKSFPSHIPSINNIVLDTWDSIGIPRNPDTGSGNAIGGHLTLATIDSKTATRSYAGSAYYSPNISRPNFLSLTGAHATKVNFEQTDDGLQRATSVTFVKDDETYTVSAKKEIILSAGSFQSPQILELSGVGNKDILQQLGIDTVIDLPGVGENLQDHGVVPCVAEVVPETETIEILRDPAELARHQALYAEQKGMLAGPPYCLFSFIPAQTIGSEEDIQGWIDSTTVESSPAEIFEKTRSEVKKGIEHAYGVTRNAIKDSALPLAQQMFVSGSLPLPGLTVDPTKRHITIFNAYSRPLSRGTVHITSTSPQTHPEIQPNYYSNPADLDMAVKVLKLALKVFDSAPLKDHVVKTVYPSGNESDEELIEYARKMLITCYHPVGTCSMLPRDLGGVVNNNLLVYGTTNLRVIDTSIIPLQVASNTQSLAYAIGEKGADIIKGLV